MNNWLSLIFYKFFGIYFTPSSVVRYIDSATGTGAYLKDATDFIIGNPPFVDKS